MLAGAFVALLGTVRGPPVASAAQRECRHLGLWFRYLGAESACQRLGIDQEAYCTASGFDEAMCVAVGEGDKPQTVRHRASALAEQHRASMWNGTCAFTIATWNNAGIVEVFLKSIVRHNPMLKCISWVVADDPALASGAAAHLVSRVDALQRQWPAVTLRLITTDDLRRTMAFDPLELAFKYDRKEFSTAIKPYAFTYMFKSGANRVMYFDPDCHFYSHLDEVALILHWRSFVLVPHETWDSPDDGELLSDLVLLQCGVFNYGFFAMSSAYPLLLEHHLVWWSAKLRYQQFLDFTNGMFYDQKWAGFIPGFYPRDAYEILLDPRYDMAYWNLHYRGPHLYFDTSSRRALYAGSPLVFFHFGATSIMGSIGEVFSSTLSSPSVHQTRYLISDFPQLQRLLEDYKRQIALSNASSTKELPYGFDCFSNGVPITPWLRKTYAIISKTTRRAFKGSGPVLMSDSLAAYLTVANPFSTVPEGSVWAWLFTPEESYHGTLRDADNGGCSITLSTNVVSKLIEDMRLGDVLAAFVSRKKDSCSSIEKLFSLLVAYATAHGGPNEAIKLNIHRLLSRDVISFQAESPCAPIPHNYLALCKAIIHGKRRAAVLGYGAGGTTQIEHHVAAEFQRLRKHVQTLQATHHGISLVGYFPHALGIADAARLIYRGLQEHEPRIAPTAVPVLIPDLPSFSNLVQGFRMSRYTIHSTTIVVVNADQSDHIRSKLRSYSRGRYWIGYWFWELDNFPSDWLRGALSYDEIWTASEFTADSIRKGLASSPLTDKIPVFVMPLGLPVPQIREVDRSERNTISFLNSLNIASNAFIFLSTFDFNSYYQRKRPDFVVRAFKLAFGQKTQNDLPQGSSKLLAKFRHIHLVIKSMNGRFHLKERSLLHSEIVGWKNIHLIEEHFSVEQMHSMHASTDCVVSLHSSEGYGLNILRPLLEGVPVISTLYSGNMEFQQYLPREYLDKLGVNFTYETLQNDYGPYTAGNRWARPHIGQAATAMQHVSDKKSQAEIRALAVQSAISLSAKFSLRATGLRMLDRLDEIDEKVRTRGSSNPDRPSDRHICCWLERPNWQAEIRTLRHLHKHSLMHPEDGGCGNSKFSWSAIDRAKVVLNTSVLLTDAKYVDWPAKKTVKHGRLVLGARDREARNGQSTTGRRLRQDGSYLAELLLNKDYEVHGMVRRTSSHNWQRIEHLTRSHLFLHYADLSDASACEHIITSVKPSELYNLAAQSHVKTSFENPLYTGDVDALGTLRLLTALVAAGLEKRTRFYQASTSELFGKVHEVPQSERTRFHPRSPYGVAKLYAYWIVVNYREAYGMHASNGILFNHESPRRGPTFVTRKVTTGVARILAGQQRELRLGNLDALRDWGHARDYVHAMWLMLQQQEPDDYVIATGVNTSVRSFVEASFRAIGSNITWQGSGVDEVGIASKIGNESVAPRVVVRVDPAYYRPAEVEQLLGDPSKAKAKLGWRATTTVDELCKEMVEADLKELRENGISHWVEQ
ncbi:hypothetical protein AB1Y20_003405 [Prymnesium parvum]|uniref:GDP-mannose 4,6-dehydratase n=1 Tax=Prymnesium parvum TaxID=97485 RepID=A0AB34JEV0_PRYPA